MIGERNYVTFCDGDKRKIIAKGKLDYPSPLFLNIVLLVDGFTVNLISISQLCIGFHSMKCTFIDKQHTQLMNGYASS